DELPDEEPNEDERQDEHDPVEVPVEADEVEPGDMRVRDRARGTAPDLLVDRRARAVEEHEDEAVGGGEEPTGCDQDPLEPRGQSAARVRGEDLGEGGR